MPSGTTPVVHLELVQVIAMKDDDNTLVRNPGAILVMTGGTRMDCWELTYDTCPVCVDNIESKHRTTEAEKENDHLL